MNKTHNPGDLLHHNQYRIEEVLGMGGQGVVYRAHHFGLEASVAIKELFDPTPETRDHFRWQARTLLHLSHPALPRVMDFFEINQRAYLVMEYIAGEDLDTKVSLYGAQSVKQVLAWADTLLDALEYLHNQEQPIIHRDIKPANLKLDANGKIYLVDFGLAKVGGLQKTTFSVAKGYTEGYAPPEQYGTARTDPRSDLYALGATLYYLLTGQTPPAATLRASGQAVPPLSSLNNSVSPALAAWIEKSMILLRDDRWPTTEVMRQAMPTVTRAKITGRHTTPPPMPNRVTIVPPQSQPTERVTTGRGQAKKRAIPWLVISLLTLIGVLLLAFTVVAMNIIGSDNPSSAVQATTPPPALTSTAPPDNTAETSQEIAIASPETATLPSATATTEATATIEASTTPNNSPTTEATHTLPAGAATSTRRANPTNAQQTEITPTIPPSATPEAVPPTNTPAEVEVEAQPAQPTNTPVPDRVSNTQVPLPTNTPPPAPPTNTPLPLPTNTPVPAEESQAPAESQPPATQAPVATQPPAPTSPPLPTNTPVPPPTSPPLPTNTPVPAPTSPPTNTPIPAPTSPPLPTNTAVPPPTAPPLPTNTPVPAPTSPPLPTNTPVPAARASYDSGPNALEPEEGATIKSETVTFKWEWNGEALAGGQQFRVMGFRDGEWKDLGTSTATQMQVYMPGFGNFETDWQWYVVVIDSAGNEISPTSAKVNFGVSLSSGGGSSGGGDDNPPPEE